MCGWFTNDEWENLSEEDQNVMENFKRELMTGEEIIDGSGVEIDPVMTNDRETYLARLDAGSQEAADEAKSILRSTLYLADVYEDVWQVHELIQKAH
jgi:hypothetical protein